MEEQLNDLVATDTVSGTRESTTQDYWNTVNPAAIQFAYPETRFNAATDTKGPLKIDAPDFKQYYDKADVGTKRAMLDATSNEEAIKIFDRRQIFNDSARAIEDDGMATQLAMGLLPALASPSSLIPMGAVFKGAQLANATSRLMKAGQVGGVGAATGAFANVADEALFDLQGMPTNYIGAASVGAIFGGALGALSGAIVGPYNKTVANAITPENDTFTKDFSQHPDLMIDFMEDGTIKLQEPAPMEKSIVDKIPWIGGVLRSDIHTVLQSDSSIMRSWMLRMASPTVSLKDASGKVLPTSKNGVDVKRQLKGVHNTLNQEVGNSYGMAREAGFTGTRSEFNKEVYRSYLAELNRQKKGSAEYANAKLGEVNLKDVSPEEVTAYKKAYYEAQNEWYDKNPSKFQGDPAITKGAEAYKNYFNTMLKNGTDLEMKGLKGISTNRLYAPRIYNYKAIHSGKVPMEQVKSQIKAALEGDPRNVFKSAEDLEIASSSIYDNMMKTTFDLNNLTNSFMVKDLPFDTHLKSKKLYLDETKMFDLLRTDFEDVAGMYHYKMSGRQATQYAFGTDDLVEIMDTIAKDHLDRGIVSNKAEVQAFERTVKDLLGDLRINGLSDSPGWTFTRNLMTYNSNRMGGGFGGNQFIELASALMMNGFKALMSGRLGTSLKTSGKLLYTKDTGIDEFSQYLINSGYLGDALHTSRINRYADTEAGFNTGMLENSLNWMNDKLMKYNGMRYFMGVMEDYTGGAIVTQLKAGGVDAARLARWGLSESDAKSLGKALADVTKDSKWEIDKLTTKQQDQLQLAISRGIDEIVVQGDSLHLPAWMKTPNAFKQVLFQFMRFPLIAQETLTRKGFKEEQATMMAAMMASSATYVGLKYLREQASIATGSVHPIDAKYDFEKDDAALERALLESLNYNAPLGFMSSLYNYGAVASGQPELGRDWQGKNGMPSLLGPSYGLGEDLIQLIRAGVNGELDTERNVQRFKSLTPYMNLPLLDEAGKHMVEEFGR